MVFVFTVNHIRAIGLRSASVERIVFAVNQSGTHGSWGHSVSNLWILESVSGKVLGYGFEFRGALCRACERAVDAKTCVSA